MNQKKSIIELSSSFQPEIRQGRVAGESFKKIRYRRNCFLIRAILTVKKYMQENLKHTVKKHLAKKLKKYSHFQTITTNNSKHFFRFLIRQYWHFIELLPNNTTCFPRLHIKQYWHFHRIPSKLNYSKNSPLPKGY